MNKRVLTLSALFAAAAVLAACSDAATTADTTAVTTTANPSVTTEAITEDPRLPSNLPDDLDFSGEDINVWYFTAASNSAESFLDLNGDAEGDIIDIALYERNLAMEEQLHVNLNFVDSGVESGDVGDEVRKVIMSADTTYDLYSVIQWNSTALALEHCFLDLTDMPYLDLDQPWWSQQYMDNLSIGNNHMYFLAGDISIDMIRCISAFYFNKNTYADYYDSADVLYQEVLDGKWTYDLMKRYITDTYNDVNGNGKTDVGDHFGLLINSFNNIDSLTFGMGTILTERDADNMPYLTISDEHNVNVYTKTYELIAETEGALMNQEGGNAVRDNVTWFSEGKSLFLAGFLYTSENLRDMEEDYGIIPYPKYDETQETYLSSVHDIATLMCLPTTCTKVDAVCAVLEAMAYYSYYEVTPVYYETALKVKYTRDEISPQIIDIIHDTSMTDIAYVYSGDFNGMGMIMRTLAADKKKDYASYYAKKEKGTLKKVEKFIEAFEESAE